MKATSRKTSDGKASVVRASGVLQAASSPEVVQSAYMLTTVGLAGLSSDFRVVRWNPAFQEICGINGEEIKNRKLEDLFPGTRPWLDTFTAPSGVDSKTSARFQDVSFVRGNGSNLLLDFDLRQLRVNDASPGFILTVTDVTRHAGVRQKLMRARDERRMIKKTDPAQKPHDNNERDFFLSVLEHELRAPLTPLLTWTGVLKQEQSLTPQMRRAITVIERNVLQQKALVDDILDLASSHAGKLILDRQRLKVHDIINGVVKQFTPKSIEKGITLTYESEAPNAIVLADARRLAQIVSNLLDNAVKFTSSGGAIQVRLSCTPERVRIQVSDTGIGIPAEFMSEIFCCFTQAHDLTSKHRRGLGLGLALVKDLVEKHNGTVDVKSDGEQKGSRFLVELPLISNSQDSNFDPALLLRGREQKILVIEDGDDTREALSMLLESWGLKVALACDGLQGLELIPKFQPNLILCDLSMPVMDGWTVARQVRERWPLAQIPLIALTGHGTSEDIKRSREAGFRDHLLKPFESHTLLQLLAAHLPPAPANPSR